MNLAKKGKQRMAPLSMSRVIFFLLLAICISARQQAGRGGRGGGGGGRSGGGRSGGGGGRGRTPPEDAALSRFLTGLWNGDTGKARFVAVGNATRRNTDIRLNIGGRTRSGEVNDVATNPLFT